MTELYGRAGQLMGLFLGSADLNPKRIRTDDPPEDQHRIQTIRCGKRKKSPATLDFTFSNTKIIIINVVGDTKLKL